MASTNTISSGDITISAISTTESPTGQPSGEPSAQPTCIPSGEPSSAPSTTPSGQPTTLPSSAPSSAPSCGPTAGPTSAPSHSPTPAPSHSPTKQPTHNPTKQPTPAPSHSPTKQPTHNPSRQPTNAPVARRRQLLSVDTPTFVTYNITVNLHDTPFGDEAALYASISGDLAASVTSGAFSTNLQAAAAAASDFVLALATSEVLVSEPLEVVTVTKKFTSMCDLVGSMSVATSYPDWSCTPFSVPEVDPCMWTGVTCTPQGYIKGIFLPNLGLTGKFKEG